MRRLTDNAVRAKHILEREGAPLPPDCEQMLARDLERVLARLLRPRRPRAGQHLPRGLLRRHRARRGLRPRPCARAVAAVVAICVKNLHFAQYIVGFAPIVANATVFFGKRAIIVPYEKIYRGREMQVIKRDGTVVEYDRAKIAIAIGKANAEMEAKERARAQRSRPSSPTSRGKRKSACSSRTSKTSSRRS